jgi:Xaa-Pro aminopeptidase
MSEILNSTKSERFDRLAKLRRKMVEQEIQAMVLTYAHYIAAVFDGAQIFNGTRPEPPGRAAIIITNNHLYVLANRTECTRISEEELVSFPNVVPQPVDWHEWKLQEAVNEWMSKQKLHQWWADSFGPDASKCRELLESLLYPLNETEIQRIIGLGDLVAKTLVVAANLLKPGVTEAAVAASIHERILREGALPDLIFAAFDERISRFRHCKPGDARFEKSALLSITASKKGLFVSATRLASIASAPEKLKEDTQIANNIEAAAICASQPGITSGEVFEAMRIAYEKYNLPGGWQEHHLGGPSGFRGRDVKVTPGGKYKLHHGQPFVYNPVVGAAKSEDTFIRLPDTGKLLCLTKDGLWPLNRVEISDAQTFERPGVLEIDAK